MPTIVIYTTQYCPYCIRAKMLLDKLGASYQEISVDNDHERRREMQSLSGGYTVPQIFINKQAIGGCDELYALHNRGDLSALLSD